MKPLANWTLPTPIFVHVMPSSNWIFTEEMNSLERASQNPNITFHFAGDMRPLNDSSVQHVVVICDSDVFSYQPHMKSLESGSNIHPIVFRTNKKQLVPPYAAHQMDSIRDVQILIAGVLWHDRTLRDMENLKRAQLSIRRQSISSSQDSSTRLMVIDNGNLHFRELYRMMPTKPLVVQKLLPNATFKKNTIILAPYQALHNVITCVRPETKNVQCIFWSNRHVTNPPAEPIISLISNNIREIQACLRNNGVDLSEPSEYSMGTEDNQPFRSGLLNLLQNSSHTGKFEFQWDVERAPGEDAFVTHESGDRFGVKNQNANLIVPHLAGIKTNLYKSSNESPFVMNDDGNEIKLFTKTQGNIRRDDRSVGSTSNGDQPMPNFQQPPLLELSTPIKKSQRIEQLQLPVPDLQPRLPMVLEGALQESIRKFPIEEIPIHSRRNQIQTPQQNSMGFLQPNFVEPFIPTVLPTAVSRVTKTVQVPVIPNQFSPPIKLDNIITPTQHSQPIQNREPQLIQKSTSRTSLRQDSRYDRIVEQSGRVVYKLRSQPRELQNAVQANPKSQEYINYYGNTVGSLKSLPKFKSETQISSPYLNSPRATPDKYTTKIDRTIKAYGSDFKSTEQNNPWSSRNSGENQVRNNQPDSLKRVVANSGSPYGSSRSLSRQDMSHQKARKGGHILFQKFNSVLSSINKHLSKSGFETHQFHGPNQLMVLSSRIPHKQKVVVVVDQPCVHLDLLNKHTDLKCIMVPKSNTFHPDPRYEVFSGDNAQLLASQIEQFILDGRRDRRSDNVPNRDTYYQ